MNEAIVQDLVDYLHVIAPNHYQESYDNAGLIVGDPQSKVKGVVVSLDCTEEIVEEAILLGANLVVCHHPIVFKGLKRFNGSNYVERTVIKAIKHDIAIFAIHTNLDNVLNNGVNEMIASKISLTKLAILRPNLQFDGNGAVGAGIVGHLSPSIDTIVFFDKLKKEMDLKMIKHTNICHSTINKVAVCGGAGSFLLSDAINSGAQAFITSDYKYHEFFDAENKIIIIDIGHFESERFTIGLLYTLISNNFTTFAAHMTKIITNPVKYY
jgi:dinuclear metal center YbgI/SA1388 family protein